MILNSPMTTNMIKIDNSPLKMIKQFGMKIDKLQAMEKDMLKMIQ